VAVVAGVAASGKLGPAIGVVRLVYGDVVLLAGLGSWPSA
jgi:hypothetical protein